MGVRYRSLAKSLLPRPVVDRIRRLEHANRFRILDDLDDNAAIFSAVYQHGMWGGGRGVFYSGHGSHDDAVVGPYVDVVSAFLTPLPAKPSVVDLGCGDFAVGSKLRDFCAGYIVCDVVPELVERNQAAFGGDFRCLDIARDDLPAGDVVFLREVLQHLDNESIKIVVDRLASYRWAVITELVPTGRSCRTSTSRPGSTCE